MKCMLGRLVASGLVLGAAMGSPVAFAGGNGATTMTQTFHNATDSFPSPNPCTGAPGTVTITYNGVLHGTINTNGSWFTGTQTGDFVFVPDDTSLPSYTGHFTNWFGDENNKNIDVEHSTFTVHGVGSDGSTLTFHDVTHVNTTANGVTLSFDKPTCG